MNDTMAQWLENRVTVVTGKSTAEIKAVGEEINSRAFYVSKLSVAAIANPLKEISRDYTLGKITLSEAQEKLRELGSGSTDEIARGLMNRSRAAQVLNNQRQLARGVAEWQSWQENKEDFPYIIYHANQDGFVRPSHKKLDGNVYSVDDPFIQTHMPGEWDYNCRCWGEQVTRKRGEREGAKKGGIQPQGKASYDAESGFMFNPSNAFMPDASELKDKTAMVQSMADSVRSGKIRKVGMIVSSPKQQYPRADLSGLDKMTEAMKRIQPIAQKSADEAGWNPKLQPGFVQQAEKYDGQPDKNRLPDKIRAAFPDEVEFGKISAVTCQEAGIGTQDVPVTLEVGSKDYGLVHDWAHHKEGFVDPSEGERIIRATLGNPAAQVSVTFEKNKDFRTIVTFFDAKTKSYCVLIYDKKAGKFRLMSWHRSPAFYGESQWEVRGQNDRANRREHFQKRHDKK